MRRWSCRHASAEVLFLEVDGDGLWEWMDHHPGERTRWPLAAVLAGELDARITALFDEAVLAEVKAAAAGVTGRDG